MGRLSSLGLHKWRKERNGFWKQFEKELAVALQWKIMIWSEYYSSLDRPG
jgi:hypothetical protein